MEFLICSSGSSSPHTSIICSGCSAVRQYKYVCFSWVYRLQKPLLLLASVSSNIFHTRWTFPSFVPISFLLFSRSCNFTTKRLPNLSASFPMRGNTNPTPSCRNCDILRSYCATHPMSTLIMASVCSIYSSSIQAQGPCVVAIQSLLRLRES